MPARPRLVASDLDGTLLRADGTVAPRTVRALELAHRHGAGVVLVTGRPVRWMADVVRATGLDGVAICSNGALVVDLGSGEWLRDRLLPVAAALDAAGRLRAALPGVAFAVERPDGFAREPEYVPRYDWGVEHEVAPLPEIAAEPLLKLLVRHEAMTSDAMLEAARPLLDGRASVTHSSIENDGLLEVAAPGVTKASALEAYAASLGLGSADVVAFGDMPNDLAMLRWAGMSYAMAGAHPDVLAAVDAVAPANDDDGVAQVLERLFGDD